MDAWRASSGAAAAPGTPAPTAAARAARGWVEGTLKWLRTEIAAEAALIPSDGAQAAGTSAGAGSPCSAAAGGGPPESQRAALRAFVVRVLAALAGWSGPELLPLLRACLQALGPVPAALAALPRGLLPRAGRRGPVQAAAGWTDASYVEVGPPWG